MCGYFGFDVGVRGRPVEPTDALFPTAATTCAVPPRPTTPAVPAPKLADPASSVRCIHLPCTHPQPEPPAPLTRWPASPVRLLQLPPPRRLAGCCMAHQAYMPATLAPTPSPPAGDSPRPPAAPAPLGVGLATPLSICPANVGVTVMEGRPSGTNGQLRHAPHGKHDACGDVVRSARKRETESDNRTAASADVALAPPQQPPHKPGRSPAATAATTAATPLR